jgi:hypothetical protein
VRQPFQDRVSDAKTQRERQGCRYGPTVLKPLGFTYLSTLKKSCYTVRNDVLNNRQLNNLERTFDTLQQAK